MPSAERLELLIFAVRPRTGGHGPPCRRGTGHSVAGHDMQRSGERTGCRAEVPDSGSESADRRQPLAQEQRHFTLWEDVVRAGTATRARKGHEAL